MNRILDAVLSTKTTCRREKKLVLLGLCIGKRIGIGWPRQIHKFSQFHSEYNEADADRKHDNILKNGGYGFSLYPLIRLAKEFYLWDS